MKKAWVLGSRPAASRSGIVSASKIVISTLDIGRFKGANAKKAADSEEKKADPEGSTPSKPDEIPAPTEIVKAWKVYFLIYENSYASLV